MSKNISLPRPQQPQLRFEGDGMWTHLPWAARQECQALLAQLLATVVRQEVELSKEATENERQD
jgi:hypothetical protein